MVRSFVFALEFGPSNNTIGYVMTGKISMLKSNFSLSITYGLIPSITFNFSLYHLCDRGSRLSKELFL